LFAHAFSFFLTKITRCILIMSMADIKFKCLGCNQSLEAPPDMARQLIDCPTCKRVIEVPSSNRVQKNSPLSKPAPDSSEGNTTSCPFCGESILSVALKCKHCGEFLDPELRRNAVSPQHAQRSYLARKSRGAYIILGIFFGLIGIHNFYAGRNRQGVEQILILVLLGWLFGIGLMINIVWVLIELFTVQEDGNGILMT